MLLAGVSAAQPREQHLHHKPNSHGNHGNTTVFGTSSATENTPHTSETPSAAPGELLTDIILNVHCCPPSPWRRDWKCYLWIRQTPLCFPIFLAFVTTPRKKKCCEQKLIKKPLISPMKTISSGTGGPQGTQIPHSAVC